MSEIQCKKSCDDCFDCDYELTDTITLKRIYSTHCQVCGEPFSLANIHLAMPTHHISIDPVYEKDMRVVEPEGDQDFYEMEIFTMTKEGKE